MSLNAAFVFVVVVDSAFPYYLSNWIVLLLCSVEMGVFQEMCLISLYNSNEQSFITVCLLQ